MITFETVTSIVDSEFDDLYDASISVLNDGSYPWHIFGAFHDVEKKNHIRGTFNRLLTDGIVCRVSDGDRPLILMAGNQDGTTVTWLVGLTQGDSSGSKSYLYSDEYRSARDAYWTEIGVTQWVLEIAGQDTPIHQHMTSRQTANKLGPNMAETSRELSPSVTIMNLTMG